MIASLLMSTCIAAYAYAPVSVAIPVEIKGGGTAVIIPEGNAIIAMPNIDDTIVTIRPIVVTGYISPYPMVVKETVAQ